MDLIDITLGIARREPSSAAGKPHKKEKKTARTDDGKIPPDIKKTIFTRDDFTCRCCSFKSQKYQEIHFLDHNPQNLSEDNMVMTCIFCHQCFNIQTVSEMRSGVLLWLPEIQQDHLHHIARAIYVARISQGPVAEAARKALDTLMERRTEAKKRITTDDPYILATVLGDYLGPKHYMSRKKKLNGLRLFPLDRRIIKEADLEFNQFPQILAYWRSKNGPFGGKVPQKWISIYQDLARAA